MGTCVFYQMNIIKRRMALLNPQCIPENQRLFELSCLLGLPLFRYMLCYHCQTIQKNQIQIIIIIMIIMLVISPASRLTLQTKPSLALQVSSFTGIIQSPVVESFTYFSSSSHWSFLQTQSPLHQLSPFPCDQNS